jgi:hypothetical protein
MADAEIPRVNAQLVERGFRVSELSPQRETLEQVFLRLTDAAPPDNSATTPDSDVDPA